MGRSILAIAAGFLTVVVLSVAGDAAMHGLGVFPAQPSGMSDGLFALASAYRAAFTVMGGVVTGLLTRRDDMRDVWILAGLGLLAGLLGIVAWFSTTGLGPLWYAVLIPVVGAPAALFGGWLARAVR